MHLSALQHTISSSNSCTESANCGAGFYYAARVESPSIFQRVSGVFAGRGPQPTVRYSILQACAILCTINCGLYQSYFGSSVSHYQSK